VFCHLLPASRIEWMAELAERLLYLYRTFTCWSPLPFHTIKDLPAAPTLRQSLPMDHAFPLAMATRSPHHPPQPSETMRLSYEFAVSPRLKCPRLWNILPLPPPFQSSAHLRPSSRTLFISATNLSWQLSEPFLLLGGLWSMGLEGLFQSNRSGIPPHLRRFVRVFDIFPRADS